MTIDQLIGNYLKKQKIVKISLFFGLLFAAQLLLSIFFIRTVLFGQVKSSLTSLNNRIHNDLRFQNGKLDTSLYNADPYTPYPHGSSGFTNPLYIITRDGFVIERNFPIAGLLDSADYKHLLSFQAPQFINSATNEQWRIESKPVVYNGNTIGVISVAYFNPQQDSIEGIDQKLNDNLSIIDSHLTVNNGAIDASKLDVRNVHYDVSFEVVDSFNKVLSNNGRMPTFIDPSYVDSELHGKTFGQVIDSQTHEPFLVLSMPLGSSASPQGVIVVGQSISSINKTLDVYTIYTILIGGLLSILLTVITYYYLRREFHAIVEIHQNLSDKIVPNKIMFNISGSYLQIDEKQIPIQNGTVQYEVCKVICSTPNKTWDLDSLIEKINGKRNKNTRKIYDAVIAINRKLQFTFIEYKNKSYRVEPSLQDIVSVEK